MPQVDINYLAVVVSALINMVLGFLWYGPLFGKEWMKLTGLTKEKVEAMKKDGSKMQVTYGMSLLGAVVIAYVLAHFVSYLQVDTLFEGVELGCWIWLGFVATTMLNQVLYDGKPWKLYLINAGYYFVSLLLMGGLLAVWK